MGSRSRWPLGILGNKVDFKLGNFFFNVILPFFFFFESRPLKPWHLNKYSVLNKWHLNNLMRIHCTGILASSDDISLDGENQNLVIING